MKHVALVLSGLVAGVLTATLLVPRVLADGPRPAVKWQQFCEPAGSIAEASSMAGARGVEGYELVGFFGGALCFKRPAPPDPRQTAAPSLTASAAPTLAPATTHPVGDTSWPGY
jgi:hypothetical protein